MIKRNRLSKNFTVINNAVLERTDISLKAKGLWAFVMTKPDGWHTTIKGLESQLMEGEASIRAALKELEAVGLYRKTRINGPQGKIAWHDEMWDAPQLAQPYVENQHVVNQVQVNTNIVNTDKINTDTALSTTMGDSGKSPGRQGDDGINRMLSYWGQATGIPIQAKELRNRYAVANLLKRCSEDDLRRLVDTVAAAQNDKYAPQVADFIDLQAKLNQLLLWGKKQVKSMEII